uniref:BACK domain-containing protein n=1 Tax=Percolomonas cosmopolitus TaxID=63605 RepID=A0A7S1KVY2_9EUKA|mmetsp:Transcript_9204/g.33984  ORF Transcript_9204/g.33984 Transcript_9204/m.33984 type:complete len:1098 (+) Transcript_9204:3-3296(+)
MTHLYLNLYVNQSLPPNLTLLCPPSPSSFSSSSFSHCDSVQLHSFVLQSAGARHVFIDNQQHSTNQHSSNTSNATTILLPPFLSKPKLSLFIKYLYGAIPEIYCGVEDESSKEDAENEEGFNVALIWLLRVWHLERQALNLTVILENILSARANDSCGSTNASLKSVYTEERLLVKLLDECVAMVDQEANEETCTLQRETITQSNGKDTPHTSSCSRLKMTQEMHTNWMSDLQRWVGMAMERLWRESSKSVRSFSNTWAELKLRHISELAKKLEKDAPSDPEKQQNIMTHFETWIGANLETVAQNPDVLQCLLSHVRITDTNCQMYRSVLNVLYHETDSLARGQKRSSNNLDQLSNRALLITQLTVQLKETIREFITSQFERYDEIFFNCVASSQLHNIHEIQRESCQSAPLISLSLLSVLDASQFWSLVDSSKSLEAIVAAFFEYSRARDLTLLRFDIEKGHALSVRLKAEFVQLIRETESLGLDPKLFPLIEHEDVAICILNTFKSVYDSKLKHLNATAPKITKIRMLFAQLLENEDCMGRAQRTEYLLSINNLALALLQYRRAKKLLEQHHDNLMTRCTTEWILLSLREDRRCFVHHFMPFIFPRSSVESSLSVLSVPPTSNTGNQESTQLLETNFEGALRMVVSCNRTLCAAYKLLKEKPRHLLPLLFSMDSLIVESENAIYDTAVEYLDSNTDASDDMRQNLFKSVRCEHLSKSHWNRFVKNTQIDPVYRLEQAMYLSNISVGSETCRLNRKAQYKTFPHEQENGCGILFALGKNLHNERFRNPCKERKHVMIETRFQQTPSNIHEICESQGTVRLIGCHGEAVTLKFAPHLQCHLSGFLLDAQWTNTRTWSLRVSVDGHFFCTVYHAVDKLCEGEIFVPLPPSTTKEYVQYIRFVDHGTRKSLEIDTQQEEKYFDALQCPGDFMLKRLEFFGTIRFQWDSSFVVHDLATPQSAADRFFHSQMKHTRKSIRHCLNKAASEQGQSEGEHDTIRVSFGYLSEDVLDYLLKESSKYTETLESQEERHIFFPHAQDFALGAEWNALPDDSLSAESGREIRHLVEDLRLFFCGRDNTLRMEFHAKKQQRMDVYERWH